MKKMWSGSGHETNRVMYNQITTWSQRKKLHQHELTFNVQENRTNEDLKLEQETLTYNKSR